MTARTTRRIVEEPLSGYCTQAAVSVRVAETINNGRLNFWFATEFNPIENEERSIPRRIFALLDDAAKTREPNWKSEDVAGNLLGWVDKLHDLGEDKKARVTSLITEALHKGTFRPRVYYLDNIVRTEKGGQPDEYVAWNRSLKDPRIDQIPPPPPAAHELPKVRRAPQVNLAPDR